MSRLAGIVCLLLIAIALGSNHVAARLAFDHGVSVPTAVVARASFTALLVLVLIRHAGLSLDLPRLTLARGALMGVLVAVQSLCLSAAVARMPVALALLVFNTFPMVLALLSWVSGGERPRPRTWLAMPIALSGLALALGASPQGFAGQAGHDHLSGTLLAVGASSAFAGVLLLTARWMPAVDGRVRTLMMMVVAAALSLALGSGLGGFRGPADATGWLGLCLLVLLYSSAITSLFVVLPKLGAVNNAAVLNFEPIAALTMGWLVLGQTMRPVQLLGAALVIGAILLLSLDRPAPASSTD